MGLISRARSLRVLPVFRCSRKALTWPLIFFRALLLMAGPNPVNTFPCLLRTPLVRKVNPRKSNEVCVLAVHNPGLVRVQAQPDLLHPLPDRLHHHAGLALGT